MITFLEEVKNRVSLFSWIFERSCFKSHCSSKIISKLAARTFVPQSEESRIKGAGGSDDAND